MPTSATASDPHITESNAPGTKSTAAPRPRSRKPRTPQLSAHSPATPITEDRRPRLQDMALPGIRRAQEGRGGATDDLMVMRTVIRSPLLAAWSAVIPARRTGRPAAAPDLFWIFYLIFVREMRTAEKLDQFLRANWQHVREEFWFTHRVLLPDAKTNDDTPNYDDFRQWRKTNILRKPGQLERLIAAVTTTALPLALAVRHAETGPGYRPDLMSPAVWDCIAADGSVMNAPSDVRETFRTDPVTGAQRREVTGSRARVAGRERVHHAMTNTTHKQHGATQGLFNTVAVTKGTDTYTRVVLGVEISYPGEAERHTADRLLHQVYDQAGSTFPVLLYDGALTPIVWQELTAQYGIYCVNANYARSNGPGFPDGFDPDAPCKQVGLGRHPYGVKRGTAKKTFVTGLDTLSHSAGDTICLHHLAADDGAVYELDRPLTAGGSPVKIGLLEPTAIERRTDDAGRYYFRLTLTGQCHRGGTFDFIVDLTYTKPNRRGHLPWTSPVANIRLLPDACVEEFTRVFAWRNQVESFFSWLERCFFHKDRHASWNREAQLLDLAAAAMLHNTETWAHLACRHPQVAAELALELAAVGRQLADADAQRQAVASA